MLARMNSKQLGPYQIGKTLGKGGMGSVYQGTHVETGELVAVKVLNPQLAISEGFRDRFEGEIESLQTLKHAGIVRLFGYGEEEGILFYAMEVVDGPSLDQEIRNGRRFNWRETAMIAIQVSRALKHAHDHGVVHRDIKPANILLGHKGQAKIADFGIARLFGSNGMTVAGGVLGTADYMSPEQAAGKPVTARCDQYSLGGVMYALLAGRPPFRADDLPAMLQLQRFAIPDPVRRYAPDTPRQMERAISQLLEKDPTKRFPNTMVLAKHLEAMTRALGKPGEDDFDVYDAGSPIHSTDNLLEGATLGPTQVAPITVRSDSNEERNTGTTPSASFVNRNSETEDQEFELPVPASRYTTVSYDAEVVANFWRPLLGPLFVFLLALSLLVGIAWWWTRPLTADQLYDRIAASHEAESNDSKTRDAISTFRREFSEDPRNAEIIEWEQALELRLLRNRLALGRVLALRRGKAVPAMEILYQQAIGIAERNSLEGTEAFQQLVTLLEGPNGFPNADNAINEAKQRRIYTQLARKEAEKYGRMVEQEEEQLLKFAAERLASAKAVSEEDSEQAKQMVEAILEILPQTDSTASVLDQANRLLDQLDTSEPVEDQ